MPAPLTPCAPHPAPDMFGPSTHGTPHSAARHIWNSQFCTLRFGTSQALRVLQLNTKLYRPRSIAPDATAANMRPPIHPVVPAAPRKQILPPA
eukprot:1975492-Prymnesium_polylepis.1